MDSEKKHAKYMAQYAILLKAEEEILKNCDEIQPALWHVQNGILDVQKEMEKLAVKKDDAQ